MKKIKHSWLYLIILSCSSISQSGQKEMNSIGPFSILSLESSLVEIKYVVTGYTRSIPPHIIKKEDSYIYDLNFKISFGNGNERWTKPIYVSLKALTEEMLIMNYDHQLYLLTDDIFPEYVCQVEVKRKGKIRVILGYENLNGEIIFDETNPFRTKEIILK